MNAVTWSWVLFAAAVPAIAVGAPPATAATPTAATDPTAAVTTAYGAPEVRLAQPGIVDRRLGGHVFTPSLLIRSPFAVTEVGADILYGTGTADGQKPAIIDGNRGDTTYEFASMGQAFYYDAAVADGVSVGGGLLVSLYSGITGPSAVVLGLEVGAGLFGRVTAGRQYGPVRAAFTFDGAYAPRYGLKLLEAIEASRQADGNVTASAFQDTNAWSVKPGFAVAWAPHPSTGLTVSADYQGVWLETNEAGWEYQSGLDAGLALDVDFGTFTTAPVAGIAAFRATLPLGSDGVETVYDYTVGAFYTGRPPLVVGAELGQRRFDYRELEAVANILQLRVQYLW